VSQLPFGTHDKLDNFISVLLTLGSPTLAAYSLALTVLNGRWVTQRFAPYSHPNNGYAVTILNNLQQSPLRIVDIERLVDLFENSHWWSQLADELNYTQTWSVSAVTNMAWVAIAYVFTVINSFTADPYQTAGSSGQGIGSLWLWLLPIVLSWLQISPKCDSKRLRKAVERANEIAYTEKQPPDHAPPYPLGNSVPQQYAIVLSSESPTGDPLRCDEHRTAPIYNYARFLPWSQAVETVFTAFCWVSTRVDPPIAGQEPPRQGRWSRNVLSRFLVASALALFLQWGTTGAAIVIVWFTPTRGLGCRSGAFLIYGGVATLIWVMLVLSSFLSHYSTTTRRNTLARVTRQLSIILRRLGKILALINAIWIVVLCLFQFGKFFERCWCDSCVLGLGTKAFNEINFVGDDIGRMKRGWIGGVVLAACSATVYAIFVNLFLNP